MTPQDAFTALAGVTATLVQDYDPVSALTELTRACAVLLGGDAAVGLLVAVSLPVDQSDNLELLASSSHDAEQLELYQAQVGEGPCVDALATNADLSVLGAEAFLLRWPRFGPALERSAFRSVHAVPLRWSGDPVGALNIFLGDERQLTPQERVATRALTDVATVTLVNARSRPRVEEITHAVREALRGRVVIEQAKGVLMHVAGLDAAAAFATLAERARVSGAPLVDVAQEVLGQACGGDPVGP